MLVVPLVTVKPPKVGAEVVAMSCGKDSTTLPLLAEAMTWLVVPEILTTPLLLIVVPAETQPTPQAQVPAHPADRRDGLAGPLDLAVVDGAGSDLAGLVDHKVIDTVVSKLQKVAGPRLVDMQRWIIRTVSLRQGRTKQTYRQPPNLYR